MKSSHQQKKAFTAATLTLFAALAILVIDDELDSLRGGYIQALRGYKFGRGLSLNLGNGKCEWKKPVDVVPEELDLYNTLIVGFPSRDKQLVYQEMEALTGMPAKDDWDFVYNGHSKAPFIKTNYPHPMGTWGWGDEADQVALVVQNIRRTIVEYSNIMWSMSSEDKFNAETEGQMNGFDQFDAQREEHIIQEIYRYGWYIDYWMENGLLRDPFTHNIIDHDNWMLWNSPAPIKNQQDRATICHRTWSKKKPYVNIEVSKSAIPDHIKYGDFYGTCEDAVHDLTFMKSNITGVHGNHALQGLKDPNCDRITGSCRPVQVISADKLRDDNDGPTEAAAIGNMLKNNDKMSKWVINRETWPCIWEHVVSKNKVASFDQNIMSELYFSELMFGEMVGEVTRLIKKYSVDPWMEDANALRLVSLLEKHLYELLTDLGTHELPLSRKDIAELRGKLLLGRFQAKKRQL